MFFYGFTKKEKAILQDIEPLLTLKFSKKQIKSINVIKSTPSEVQQLNKTYRKKDKVTDVLSFENQIEEYGGDIYICTEIIKQQAINFTTTYEKELVRMTIHGVLHLLGYDHIKKFGESNEEIFSLQESLLENYEKQ